MKALPAGLALLLLAGTALQAKDQKPVSPPKNGVAELKKGLDAMIAAAQPGPPGKTADKDQGDDHASDRALEVVCGKDTPAARRSAICPVPISP